MFGVIRLHGIFVSTKRTFVPKLQREDLLFQRYEKYEINLVKKYIRQGDKVLEIGAGMGVVGIIAAKTSGDTDIVVCEPNLKMAPVILKNYALNRLTPTLVSMAVTADGRDIDFFQDSDILGSSMFDRPNRHDGFAELKIGSVPINDLISKHHPSVLLIDAEGAEVEILAAADLTGIKTIIVETHRMIVGDAAIDTMIEHLEASGFAIQEQARITLCLQRT